MSLELQEDDIKKLLTCGCHIGTSSTVDFQMRQYVYGKTEDGLPIFNINKIWAKLMLAARAIVAIEHPADVFVISSRTYGQRAILKYAGATRATPVNGRFMPGAFTNHAQQTFHEPRLLVVTDPVADAQPIVEASYVNLPVIAFCSSDTPLKYVDIAIPCNNRSIHSIGLMWWLLAREVLRIRGTLSRAVPWEIMPDLFFYRDPEEEEKQEQTAAIAEKPVGLPDQPAAPTTQDWEEEWAPTEAPAPAAPPAAGTAVQQPAAPALQPTTDWSAEPTTEWSATPDTNWGGAATEQW